MSINELQTTKKPPISQFGIVLWLRTNLFSNWTNGALTILSLYMLYLSIPPLLDWILLSANFNFGAVNIFGFNIHFSEELATNANCGQEGACWPFIYEKFDMFIYGFYPREDLWRPNVVFVVTALLFVIVRLVRNFRYKNIVFPVDLVFTLCPCSGSYRVVVRAILFFHPRQHGILSNTRRPGQNDQHRERTLFHQRVHPPPSEIDCRSFQKPG